MRIQFLILFILSLFETKAQFSQVCFLSTNTQTITNTGNALVSADFNGDNKPDLAISSGGSSNTVSVLINTGNGIFATPVDYSVGVGPVAIVAGDFNNDGKVDLATSNYNQGFSILLGTGNGAFSTPTSFNGGNSNRDVVTADFNSDGKADLAFSCENSNNVYVSLGNGSGSFSSGSFYPAGSSPVSITKGDFNNDGKPDLAVANSNSSRATVLLNTGTGFAPVVDYLLYPSLYYNIRSITSSDFNGDGYIDLVVTSSPTSGNSPYGSGIILLGSSAGSFAVGGGFSTGSDPRKVIAGDFNADGKSDIATANGPDITILIGNGNATFAYPNFYPMESGNLNNSLITSDFNGDGKLDLATTLTQALVPLLIGTGDGTFIYPRSYPVGVSPTGITSDDFNNDGNTDIATVNSNSISIALGTNTGTFVPVTNFMASGLTYMKSVKAADFNNDGKPDLFVTTSNNVSVLLGIGTGSFSAPINTSVPATLGSGSFAIKDLNNDGILDLAYGSSSYIYVNLGIGNGAFSNTISYPLSNSTNGSITANDFNGDGILDLVVTMNTSTDKICILYGTGAGAFAAPIYFGGTLAIGGSIISADFNSDGKSDIVTYDYTGYMNIILSSGTNTFSPATNYYIGNAQGVITSDITGDGKLDLIITSNYNFSIMPGLGNGTFGSGISFPVRASNIAADFNNDGKLDLAGISLGSFYVTVALNDSPTFTLSTTSSVCIGSSAVINATGGSSYNWSSGGTGNSITVNPTATTTYTATNTSLSGCTSSKTISVIVDNTCQDVWPGDANSDGIADNIDVLELGLHYTQTGAPRASTSNVWQSYFSNNWPGTITSGKNLNHSDCNGDGVIDNNDTLAIYNNYNLTHAFKTAQTTTVSSQLSIIPDQPIVNKGEWGTSSVFLGDNTNQINAINGLAYTINFNNSLIETDSIYIEYLTSFLNSNNQNLNFDKRVFANGVIYTATTHTNNSNVSGNGKIATLHYKINAGLTTDQILNIDLVQANKSDASGVIMPLTSGSGTLIAKGTFVGLQEIISNNFVSLNPNPTNGLLTVTSKEELQKIEVVTITGQIVLSEIPTGNNHILHLENFANGIYFVNLFQNNHIIKREKVIVNK